MFRRALLLAGGVVSAALAFIAVRDSGGLSVVPNTALGMTVLFAAGGTTTLVGVWLARGGRAGGVGILLGISGVMWFLGVCATPGAPRPLIFTVGSIAASLAAAVVAHLAFLAPAGTNEMSGPARATVVAGYAVTGFAGLGAILFADPRLHGCGQCPANALLIRDDAALSTALTAVGVWATLPWMVLAGSMLAARILRAARRKRHVTALVGGFGLVFVLGAARPLFSDVGLAPDLAGWAGRSMVWMVQGCALTAIALTLALARRTARQKVRALSRALLERGRAGHMTVALRTALGDPTLQITYPTGDGGHLTEEGELAEVERSDGRRSTALASGGIVSATVAHSPALFDLPGLSEDVAATARLDLEHERLLALRKAQLRALEASHDRLARAASDERRRLARDLHDGAQQQLVGLALLLRLARTRSDELALSAPAESVADRLAAAQEGIDASLMSLRSLTRRLQPEYEAPDGESRPLFAP